IIDQNIGLTRKVGYLYSAGMKGFQSTDYTVTIDVSQYPYNSYAAVNPSFGLSGNPTIWLSQAVRNPLVKLTNQLNANNNVSEIGAGGKLISSIPGVSGPALQLLSFFYVQNIPLAPN